MASYESSMRNLAKARARGRPPRPWRSKDESRMIQRFVFLWLTCRGTRPSGRSWERDLHIEHVLRLSKATGEFSYIYLYDRMHMLGFRRVPKVARPLSITISTDA
jgi:hypothetical protein